MVLGVVGYVYAGLVVHVQVDGAAVVEAEFGGEPAEMDGILASLGGGDDLSFARGERDGLLFLRPPGDGGPIQHEDVPRGRVARSPI